MADVFPLVPGGYVIAPMQRSATYSTQIAQFEDGSEQRYADRAQMGVFTLNLHNIGLSDRFTVDAFIASKKGTFDNTWSFSFVPDVPALAATYVYCAFDDDVFRWTEQSEGQFAGTIRFRQTRRGGSRGPLPNGLTDFPGFGPLANAVTGFPYVSEDNFYVAKVDLPVGVRSAYFFTGMPGFASRPTKSWQLTHTTLSNAEIDTLQSHFVSAAGRLNIFGYTDPKDHKRYPRVRYDSDSLDFTHEGYDVNSVTVKLREVYGFGWVP